MVIVASLKDMALKLGLFTVSTDFRYRVNIKISIYCDTGECYYISGVFINTQANLSKNIRIKLRLNLFCFSQA